MRALVCRLAGLLIATALLASHAGASVIGKDDRTDVPGEYRRLADGIGLLYNAEASYACTAFCVAADVIATNAHCLLRKSGPNGEVRLGDMRFSPYGPVQETNTFQYSLKHVSDDQPRLSILAGHSRGGATISQQAGDWAFAKLNFAVCLGLELEFSTASRDGISRAAKDNRLFMIGYHGDKMLIEKWFSPCNIRSSDDRRHFLPDQRRLLRRSGSLLPHTCDMYEGASGSPIFMEEDGKFRVVAINTGGVGYSEYRQSADGTRRNIVASRVTNLAVLTSGITQGLERFESENLLGGIEEFKELQTLLKKKGYYRSAIDGVYGPGTRAAIIEREKELGLVSLGMPTWELLLGLRDEAAQDDDVVETAAGKREMLHSAPEKSLDKKAVEAKVTEPR